MGPDILQLASSMDRTSFLLNDSQEDYLPIDLPMDEFKVRIRKIFEKVDKNNNLELDRNEFNQFTKLYGKGCGIEDSHFESAEWMEYLDDAFNVMDNDGEGTVSWDEAWFWLE